MALTSTSIFGTVYEARPRNVVSHGSEALQADWPSTTPLAAVVVTPTVVVGVIGRPKRPISTSQVSLAPRPVLVPPWNCSPLFRRAFNAKSTPCQ